MELHPLFAAASILHPFPVRNTRDAIDIEDTNKIMTKMYSLVVSQPTRHYDKQTVLILETLTELCEHVSDSTASLRFSETDLESIKQAAMDMHHTKGWKLLKLCALDCLKHGQTTIAMFKKDSYNCKNIKNHNKNHKNSKDNLNSVPLDCYKTATEFAWQNRQWDLANMYAKNAYRKSQTETSLHFSDINRYISVVSYATCLAHTGNYEKSTKIIKQCYVFFLKYFCILFAFFVGKNISFPKQKQREREKKRDTNQNKNNTVCKGKNLSITRKLTI